MCQQEGTDETIVLNNPAVFKVGRALSGQDLCETEKRKEKRNHATAIFEFLIATFNSWRGIVFALRSRSSQNRGISAFTRETNWFAILKIESNWFWCVDVFICEVLWDTQQQRNKQQKHHKTVNICSEIQEKAISTVSFYFMGFRVLSAGSPHTFTPTNAPSMRTKFMSISDWIKFFLISPKAL